MPSDLEGPTEIAVCAAPAVSAAAINQDFS